MYQKRGLGTGVQTCDLNIGSVLPNGLKCAEPPLSSRILAIGVPQTHNQKNEMIYSTEGQAFLYHIFEKNMTSLSVLLSEKLRTCHNQRNTSGTGNDLPAS